MNKETTIVGTIAILAAIVLHLKTKLISLPVILGVLGLILLLSGKEKTKQRKNLKNKKRRKK